MCNNCGPTVRTYGQNQPKQREADRLKLDKVLKARSNRLERKENAHLN